MKIKNLTIVLLCTAALTLSSCSMFQIEGANEVEPNDQRNLADRVNTLVIDGAMGSSTDVDWFVLAGQEGVTPSFIIRHEPGVDFDFEIYDSSGGFPQVVGRAVGVNSGDSIRVRTPGLVHVKVWSHNGSGRYQIQIIPRRRY